MQFGPGALFLYLVFLYMSPRITIAYSVGYAVYTGAKDYFGSTTALPRPKR